MMTPTHVVFAVGICSFSLATSDSYVLATAGVSSLLPDIDTTRSLPGRLLFPIAWMIERYFPHRSITHSFLGTSIFLLLTSPALLFVDSVYWRASVLGFFLGWVADMMTKSGVTAAYPSMVRWVIPGNPKLRLQTGSSGEYFFLFVITAFTCFSIWVNTTGGFMANFNRLLGLPSGAVQEVSVEGSQFLFRAKINGRNQITQQPIDDTFEVVEPLTQNDLLVYKEGQFFRAGRTQQAQIWINSIRLKKGRRITEKVERVRFDNQVIGDYLSALRELPERTYIYGSLFFDGSYVEPLVDPEQYQLISISYGNDRAIAQLKAVPPSTLFERFGNYRGSGYLIIRSVYVQ